MNDVIANYHTLTGKSSDVSKSAFLRNGKLGEWNSGVSEHPHIFTDSDGKTYLFYQRNNDHGKTWFIMQQEILRKEGKLYLK